MKSIPFIIYGSVLAMILCLSATTARAQTACVKPFAVEDAARNVGDRVTLKSDRQIFPGWFQAINLPGGEGGDWYRSNIEGCNGAVLREGDPIVLEHGNMVGPTKQGVDALISLDPGAYWDEANDCVVSEVRNGSPRIIAIPLYDANHFASTGELRMTRSMFLFVEAMIGGKEIVTRVTAPNRLCAVTEPREVTCDDGRDNDGDGAIDCQDEDCSGGPC